MPPVELKSGLWRWTAPHPDWHESSEPGSSSDWPREVGCTLYQAATEAVFIDPLVPPGEDAAFWRWADARCRRRGVRVLTTISFHRRSRDAFLERYGASTSRAKANLPPGVESLPLKGAGETLFWLPEAQTLVAGDRLISDADGRLRLCPQSWLDYLPSRINEKSLKELLRPLLDLPIETILVSHGEPLLEDAKAALARALR